jgi:hypothetical protein
VFLFVADRTVMTSYSYPDLLAPPPAQPCRAALHEVRHGSTILAPAPLHGDTTNQPSSRGPSSLAQTHLDIRLLCQLEDYNDTPACTVVCGAAMVRARVCVCIPCWPQSALHAVRPAAWIRDAAAKWVQEQLGGKPFLAVHIWPFPDKCMKASLCFQAAAIVSSCLVLGLGRAVAPSNWVLDNHCCLPDYVRAWQR